MEIIHKNQRVSAYSSYRKNWGKNWSENGLVSGHRGGFESTGKVRRSGAGQTTTVSLNLPPLRPSLWLRRSSRGFAEQQQSSPSLVVFTLRESGLLRSYREPSTLPVFFGHASVGRSPVSASNSLFCVARCGVILRPDGWNVVDASKQFGVMLWKN